MHASIPKFSCGSLCLTRERARPLLDPFGPYLPVSTRVLPWAASRAGSRRACGVRAARARRAPQHGQWRSRRCRQPSEHPKHAYILHALQRVRSALDIVYFNAFDIRSVSLLYAWYTDRSVLNALHRSALYSASLDTRSASTSYLGTSCHPEVLVIAVTLLAQTLSGSSAHAPQPVQFGYN